MFVPVQRLAGISGMVGGFLWAVTPLRQPIFDAGRTPEEGETFFRMYNLVIIAIAVLLTIALVRLRRRPMRVTGRLFTAGWSTILVGHVLLLVGSLPAAVFGDQARSLVKVGQDLGFTGALIAGLGGFLVGVSTLRQHRRRAGTASWLLLLTAAGVPEDYLGLPLTVLYGGAWMVLGSSWLHPSGTATSPVGPRQS